MIWPQLYDLMLFLHLVLFVYWLGPDWGVYVMAPRIWDPSLSIPERRRWAMTLVRLSQISRNSLILLIPVGVTLAYELGATSLSWFSVLLVWAAAAAWVAVSVTMHRKRGTPIGAQMTRIDQSLRIVLIPGLLIVAGVTLAIDQPFNQNWIGLKLMFFAFLLFNSIQQRNLALKWVDALNVIEKAENEAGKAAAEQVFEKTAGRSKFNAYLTWSVTLIIAFLGTTKLI